MLDQISFVVFNFFMQMNQALRIYPTTPTQSTLVCNFRQVWATTTGDCLARIETLALTQGQRRMTSLEIEPGTSSFSFTGH